MNLRNMTISELLRQETTTELETVLSDQFTKILDQVQDLKDKLDKHGEILNVPTFDLEMFGEILGNGISFQYEGSMASYNGTEYSEENTREIIKRVDKDCSKAYVFYTDEILFDITGILENFS